MSETICPICNTDLYHEYNDLYQTINTCNCGCFVVYKDNNSEKTSFSIFFNIDNCEYLLINKENYAIIYKNVNNSYIALIDLNMNIDYSQDLAMQAKVLIEKAIKLQVFL